MPNGGPKSTSKKTGNSAKAAPKKTGEYAKASSKQAEQAPERLQNPELDKLYDARLDSYTFSLEDPLVFGRMLAFSRTQHDKNSTGIIVMDDKPLAVLKRLKPSNHPTDFGSEASIVWCFPGSETSQNIKPLSYEEFGNYLKGLGENTAKKIARLVLRYMRVASRLEDNEEAKAETLDLLNKLSLPEADITNQSETKTSDVSAIPKTAHNVVTYTPRQLFAQLLGAAACEAGRAPNGFLSMLATMHRVKHQKDAFADTLLKEIFKTQALTTDFEKTLMHGIAFIGSQNVMRFNANLETGLSSTPAKTWNPHYQVMLQRDIDYFKGLGEFDEKVIIHYKAAEQLVTFSSPVITIPVNNALNPPTAKPPTITETSSAPNEDMEVSTNTSVITTPQPTFIPKPTAESSTTTKPHDSMQVDTSSSVVTVPQPAFVPKFTKAFSSLPLPSNHMQVDEKSSVAATSSFQRSSSYTAKHTRFFQSTNTEVHSTTPTNISSKVNRNHNSTSPIDFEITTPSEAERASRKRASSEIELDETVEPPKHKPPSNAASEETFTLIPIEQIKKILEGLPGEKQAQILQELTEWQQNPQQQTATSVDENEVTPPHTPIPRPGGGSGN